MRSNPRPGRLVRRITLIFSLAITALLVVLAAAFALLVYNNQHTNTETLQRETAQRVAVSISAHLDSLRAPLLDAARLCAVFLCTTTNDQPKLLNNLLAQNPAYLELALLDSQGHVAAAGAETGYSLPAVDRDADRTAAAAAAQQGKSYLGPVRVLADEQEPYVVMSEPLPNQQGALLAWIDVRHVWEIVRTIQVGESGYAYVLDADGRLIAYRDPAPVLAGRNPVSEIPGLKAHLQGTSNVGEYPGLNGSAVIGSHAPIISTNWVVVVETPLAEAYFILYRSLILIASLLIVGIILGAVIARYLATQLLKPVGLLREGATLIGAGELDHRIAIETGDEIEELANEFNRMTQNLRRARSELEAWAHELERRVEERTNEVIAQKQQLAVLEERQRVARELHDSIAQLLFTVTLNLDSALVFLQKEPARVPLLIERARRVAQNATAEVRALIYDLRPVALEQGGLKETLAREFAAVSARTSIAIELQADGLRQLAPAVEDALYRIALEALNNAVNHGQPTHVIVQVVREVSRIVLTVTDDGAGFDPTTTFPAHFGLKTMRERARGLGGDVKIESLAGRGTTVRAEIPYASDQET